MDKIGIIISNYNKWDDFGGHAEILDFYPFNFERILVHMTDIPEWIEADKFHKVRINGVGHHIGPLLSLIAGIRKAKQLGLKYVVYRNSDDWLFNYDFEIMNFKMMEKNNYLYGGYNWLSENTFHDLTLNQLYLNVDEFYKTVDEAEDYFLKSKRTVLCEIKMMKWAVLSCGTHRFYRLPYRESSPGVGYFTDDILYYYGQTKQIDNKIIKSLEKNNRFYNEEWQLIGSHDLNHRIESWQKLKMKVDYSEEIESKPFFQKMIYSYNNSLPWNEGSKSIPQRLRISRSISTKIF